MNIKSLVHRHHGKALVVLPLVVSLLGASMAVCAAPNEAAAAPRPVATLVAREAAGSAALTLDGVAQPLRQATLSSQVGGNVVQLSVKAGDRVHAGQVVAQVDARELQAGLQRSQAGVAQAEAEWRNAKLQTERSRDLRAQGFVSQAALDVAETQLEAAQAGLAQARAGRSQAALARGFTTVTAPFNAVVLATHVEAGDLAAPGRAIATVYAPGAMRAVVQVPASLAAQARAARTMQVLLPDGRVVEPASSTVLPMADPVSQTIEWRLDLPASALAGNMPVLPGQSLRVNFLGTPAAAEATTAGAAKSPTQAAGMRLIIPAAALLRRGELTAVFVVQQQRFVLRAVRAGVDRGAAGVEILAGLRAGERLAADAVLAGLDGAVPAAAAN